MKKDNFKEFKGYKFDKRIFQLCTVFIIIFFVVIVVKNGFTPVYFYECLSPVGCELDNIKEFCVEPNILDEAKYPLRYEWLQACGLCSADKVSEGFVCGERAQGFQGSEGFIAGVFVFLAFLVNHTFHNKDYKYGEEDKE